MLGSIGAVPKPSKTTLPLTVPLLAVDNVTVVPEMLETVEPPATLVPVTYIPATMPAAAPTVREVEAPVVEPVVVTLVALPLMSVTVVPLYSEA